MAISGENFEQPFEDREAEELEEKDQLADQYGEELNNIDAKLKEKKAEDRKIAQKVMETMNPDDVPAEREEEVEEKRAAEEEKSA